MAHGEEYAPRAISFRTCALKPSGVVGAGSAPKSAKRFFMSSVASTLWISAFSLSSTPLGVLAGAKTPHHNSLS